MGVTWDDLAGKALARQFPTEDLSLVDLLTRIGPIQAQTARSPFLGLAARAGVSHRALSAAYETGAVVRGSTIRGTVHTVVPTQHRVLDATTRVAQRQLWERTLRLEHHSMNEVWRAIEEYAEDTWRTPSELLEHLIQWLSDHGETRHRLRGAAGRYFAFGHGGLVRRPLGGGWEGQGAAGYRSAAAVTGLALPTAADAPDAAVRLHLRSHGPASRHDLAWWSRLGLRVVDDVLDRLSTELVSMDGPMGRVYHDLRGSPDGVDIPGVRLLPEFDALLCGYDSKARDRFVSPEHHERLWNPANGMILPPMMIDGRITGYWRMTGPGRRRALSVSYFDSTRRPRRGELDEPVAALARALGTEVAEVRIDSAG